MLAPVTMACLPMGRDGVDCGLIVRLLGSCFWRPGT